MAWFTCMAGVGGKGNSVIVTCDADFAGIPITCTNGQKTYTKVCPSFSPYEVNFTGLVAGTWTISATVDGVVYSTTAIVTDITAVLSYGFNWKMWVDSSSSLHSEDYTDLADLLSDEAAIRQLFTEHAPTDYAASTATVTPDLATVLNNDLCAKWINLRDYALDTLYANPLIATAMDSADKYFYGEWGIVDNTTTPPTWGAKGNVPIMTANNAPYGEASASSVNQSGYEAYKAFDDNPSPTTGNGWTASSSASFPQWIQYKFVNPVCAKRMSLRFNIYNASATVKVSASNDGSTFTDIVSGITVSETEEKIVSMADNNNYYLIYRLTITAQTRNSGASIGQLVSLQFYGRELKPLVPIMTSDTTPYGEVIYNAQNTHQPAYNVFDSDTSNVWGSGNNTNSYVGYKFVNPVMVKKVSYRSALDSGVYRIKNFKIQASNYNSTWTDLYTGIAPQDVNEHIIEINNDEYYLFYRMYISDSYGAYGICVKTLQFYGLDYSEKEFEEGANKKWLYDHGVEVVAIDAMRDAGSKQSDCLNVAVGSSSANNTYGLTTPTDAIDLTPYSLIRAKVGKSMVGTIQPQASTQKTSYDSGRISYISIDQSHNKAMIPNDLTLDISSVNQNAYPNFIVGSTNMNTDIAEWWLE